MELKILFDNQSIDESRFEIGWGFSCLVGEKILFDTGENGDILLHNAEKMGVDIGKIEKIVISHDHYDHTGGLEKILQRNKNLEVFLLPDFSQRLKREILLKGGKVTEVKEFEKIDEDIFTTGKIEGTYMGEPMPEQSLVINGGMGIGIITGCSHPGILSIIDRVKKEFPKRKITLVLGGFHLLEKDKRELEFIAQEMKKLGIERVGPTHCTGPEAIEIFKKQFGESFVRVGAGLKIEF